MSKFFFEFKRGDKAGEIDPKLLDRYTKEAQIWVESITTEQVEGVLKMLEHELWQRPQGIEIKTHGSDGEIDVLKYVQREMDLKSEYRICDCGKPMISTMAFRGAELWCWNCGNNEGIFNGLIRRTISEDELNELMSKTQESGDFRHAQACMFGGGRIDIEGKIVGFDEFPEDMKEKMTKDVKSWAYA